MPAYEWYATPVNSAGTSTAASTLVTVWVGPSNPGGYTIFILDSNGDGLVNAAEWQSYTGGGLGLNGGTATVLFDGAPGGAGIIYSATAYPVGTTGLKAGLQNQFNVDPANLDPTPPPCFCAGTLIAVPGGARPVEDLRPGDLVTLADGGSTAVIWAGRRHLGAESLQQRRHLCPVIIPQGALGGGRPSRRLALSPHHRVLLSGPHIAAACGAAEVLVPAIRLVGLAGIHLADPGQGVTYHHLLLPRHHLLLSEGLVTESLYLGLQARQMLPVDVRDSLPAELGLGPDEVPVPARPLINGIAAKQALSAWDPATPAQQPPEPGPAVLAETA